MPQTKNISEGSFARHGNNGDSRRRRWRPYSGSRSPSLANTNPENGSCLLWKRSTFAAHCTSTPRRSSKSIFPTMIPDKRFVGLPKTFWALVRLVGQECGYASHGKIAIPTQEEVTDALARLGLSAATLSRPLPRGADTWSMLLATSPLDETYFTRRWSPT